MRTYIRNRVQGGTYFFTVNLARRCSNTLLIDRIDQLRKAYRLTCAERPFETLAVVVLPEHLHAIWRLPEGDDDYPARWRLLKGRFSHAVANQEKRSKSRLSQGERGIWQQRYWEHTIRDDIDSRNHIDYIHFNPVKHGWCETPHEWRYSSLHRYIRQELISSDWAVSVPGSS